MTSFNMSAMPRWQCGLSILVAVVSLASASGMNRGEDGGVGDATKMSDTTDPRDARVPWGTIFSAGNGTGYSDQPQVVIINASFWLCVVTCSPGHEGQRSQIVGTTVSHDGGSAFHLASLIIQRHSREQVDKWLGSSDLDIRVSCTGSVLPRASQMSNSETRARSHTTQSFLASDDDH